MRECLNCGHQLIWQSDFNSDECGYEDDGIVSFYLCPHCGAMHEVFVPSHWEGDNDERVSP